MIINRNDYHELKDGRRYGVGHQLMSGSCYDPADIQLLLQIIVLRRRYFSDGVIALDCGANIGVHSVEWANAMHGWGRVHAFEAQERLFYALAGNLTLNNCLNAKAHWAALSDQCGSLLVPELNYAQPASFGSFELQPRQGGEFIGQAVDYSAADQQVPMLTLDSLKFSRADLIKIDVEGMEIQVLHGAKDLIKRTQPVLFVEVIKSDRQQLNTLLAELGYQVIALKMNLLAVHKSDPLLNHLQLRDNQLHISNQALNGDDA